MKKLFYASIFLAFLSCQFIEKALIINPDTGSIVVTSTRFYVSPNGDDSRSLAQANNPLTPWKTIQHAVNNLSAGDTLLIGEGVYFEKVVVPSSASGTAQDVTLITNVPGDEVILDGNNEGGRFESLFRIESASHIEVRGLKAENASWYGFSVNESEHIEMAMLSTNNTGASGIYARLSSFIDIHDNNIRRACQVQTRDSFGNGSQECITITATENFKIYNNEVWDVPLYGEGGEGIDAKGGSHTGEIYNNYMHDLARVGIYVDAGSKDSYDIKVYGNKVIRSGSGICLAGEIGGTLEGMYVYNNLFADNDNSGVIFLSLGNGLFTNIYIVNNTLYNNGKKGFYGDVSNFSKNVNNSNIQIKNNIFYNQTENYRYSIFHDIAAPHVISHNLFYVFKPGWAGGENNFSSANLTAADVLLDPLFVDITSENFSLSSSSPAIDRGIPVYFPGTTIPIVTKDFNGKTRSDGTLDLGAFEL